VNSLTCGVSPQVIAESGVFGFALNNLLLVVPPVQLPSHWDSRTYPSLSWKYTRRWTFPKAMQAVDVFIVKGLTLVIVAIDK